MVEKRNIFLIGPMGSGKSTVGRQLAERLCMSFFDSDNEIEKRTGADISWVFDVEGETKFRIREEKVIHELTGYHGVVLATGGGSIISEKNRCYLASRGFVVYLETSVEKQFLRTQYDKKRPLLQQVQGDLRSFLKELSFSRNPLYEEIADIRICTDEKHPRVIVHKIIGILKLNFS